MNTIQIILEPCGQYEPMSAQVGPCWPSGPVLRPSIELRVTSNCKVSVNIYYSRFGSVIICYFLEEQQPAVYALNVTKIATFLAEAETYKILEMAIDLGFEPAWLDKKKGVKKQTPGSCFF